MSFFSAFISKVTVAMIGLFIAAHLIAPPATPSVPSAVSQGTAIPTALKTTGNAVPMLVTAVTVTGNKKTSATSEARTLPSTHKFSAQTRTEVPFVVQSTTSAPVNQQSYTPEQMTMMPASDTNPHAGDSAYWQMNGIGMAGKVLSWQSTGSADWTPVGTPPACPSPLTLTPPIDFSKASGILYPGQTRGGQYKAHGGFRFDNAGNTITVTIPLDAQLFSASRYVEIGEVQYLLFFLAPCGIMYRFDHLHNLTPELLAKLDPLLPQPKANDSRTTSIDPPISFHVGDTVATVVGFVSAHNASMDFGVYDMRTHNVASKDFTWSAQHSDFYSQHAVCWLDWFNTSQNAFLRSLPAADFQSGKTSDFCK